MTEETSLIRQQFIGVAELTTNSAAGDTGTYAPGLFAETNAVVSEPSQNWREGWFGAGLEPFRVDQVRIDS